MIALLRHNFSSRPISSAISRSDVQFACQNRRVVKGKSICPLEFGHLRQQMQMVVQKLLVKRSWSLRMKG